MEDDTPPPRLDPRLDPLVHPVEATARMYRYRNRVHQHTVRRRTPTVKHVRLAKYILADLGDAECPLHVVPSPELVYEARRALGWSRSEAAWRLGFDRRSTYHITRVEHGVKPLPRFARLLLVAALRTLDASQHGKRRG